MRRLVFPSLIVLALVAGVLAQGPPSGTGGGPPPGTPAGGRPDDHNDNSQTQSGYAVVTPVGATTSGLLVFETFGLKSGQETTQAGVLPPDMTTNAVMFVNSSGRLSRNLGVAIANPSSSGADVTMTLRKDDGSVLGTATVAVAARQQTAKFVTELFSGQSSVPTDVTGMLSITSVTPVSVIGLRFRGKNFSAIPVTNLSAPAAVPVISAGVGGAGALLLPQFATGGGWATEIVMANTGTSSLTVRVDLFRQDGTALTATLNGTSANSFTNISIPAGGVVTLAPRDDNGDSRF